MAAPANDDFANAILLTGDAGSVTVDITDATEEGGEPVGSAAGAANQTVWYRIVGDGTRKLVDLLGSFQTASPATQLDTVLAVYTGASLAGLVEVVSGDDSFDGVTSRIFFDSTDAVDYWVQAGTFAGGEAGSIILAWYTAPANDDFVNSEAITATIPGSASYQVRALTQETDWGEEPGDAWFTFTAAADGILVATTAGSSLQREDTAEHMVATVRVLEGGPAIVDLSPAGSGFDGSITVPVTAGTQYWFVLTGDNVARTVGEARVAWRFAVAEPRGVSVAFDSDTLDADALWTRLDDPEAPWKVTGFTVDRGKRSEFERNDAGTAVIDLIDLDGTFDPTNPSAPLPLTLARQAVITVQNPVTGEWRHLFTGFTKEYPGQFYTTGRLAEVPLQLGDGFEYLQGVLMYHDDPVRFGDDPPVGVGPNLYFPQTGGVSQVRGRLNLALDQAGWPAGWRHVFSGNIILQAWQYPPGTSIFNVLEEAVEAEFPAVGVHFMSRRGNYVFRGRYPRFDPDSYLASDDDIRAGAAGEGGRLRKWSVGGRPQAEADLGTEAAGYRDGTAVIADLAYSLSWNDVINAAGALPNNVDDTDVPGNLVTDTASIDQYGWRFGPDMENLLVQHGNTPPGRKAVPETRLYAEYWVENFKQPITRITRLLFRPRDANDALAPALWAFMLGVELGDVVHVTTDHFDDAGGFDDDYFIEGIHYRASNLGRPGLPDLELELDVSPRGFYTHNPWATTVDGDVPEE